MNFSTIFVLTLATLFLALGCSPHPADDAPQIQASQLLGNPPIGILGKPLGERLIVEGTRAEHILLANPIAISRVDGQPLPITVPIEVQGIDNLKPGITYKLEGYESGAFAGDPNWKNPDVQQPFQYHPFFVVTRTIEPATK